MAEPYSTGNAPIAEMCGIGDAQMSEPDSTGEAPMAEQ